MKEFTSTITQRGQVTVPAAVRRALDLRPHSKVTFTIVDGHARLEPATYTVETVHGSVQPIDRADEFRELSRIARDERAAEVVR